MGRFTRILWFLSLLVAICGGAGCAPKRPVLTLTPKLVGAEGKVSRELYRGFWFPPSSGEETISVGIVPSAPMVRFRALKRMKIRAYGENQSWEVASPAGVIWRVENAEISRPPVLAFFPVVDLQLAHHSRPADSASIERWKERGYPSARWVLPPAMDIPLEPSDLERRLLSLSGPLDRPQAEEQCKSARRGWETPCQVFTRVELPPLGGGLLKAESSNFSQPFQGILELLSPDGAVEIHSTESSPILFGPKLFVVPGIDRSFSIVQRTTLNDYLDGVVPAEIFADAPTEALRAQAVVARTYAVRGVSPEFSGRPFLLCASVSCQVYRGEVLKKPSTRRAVRDTDPLVLWDPKGELAETFYHSICGGHTEPRTKIWGPPDRPYLHGVSDQKGAASSEALTTDAKVREYLAREPSSYCGTTRFTIDRWRWETHLDTSTISSLLSSLDLRPPLLDLRVTRRSVSGRALALELSTPTGSKKISGELNIRKQLGGLPSSLFVADLDRSDEHVEAIHVHGGGSGHGVGMCQMGAIGRAESGQRFDQILRAYYPGTLLAPLSASMLK